MASDAKEGDILNNRQKMTVFICYDDNLERDEPLLSVQSPSSDGARICGWDLPERLLSWRSIFMSLQKSEYPLWLLPLL